jgi:hypothetical protein
MFVILIHRVFIVLNLFLPRAVGSAFDSDNDRDYRIATPLTSKVAVFESPSTTPGMPIV